MTNMVKINLRNKSVGELYIGDKGVLTLIVPGLKYVGTNPKNAVSLCRKIINV